jgi:hypothetical protein
MLHGHKGDTNKLQQNVLWEVSADESLVHKSIQVPPLRSCADAQSN